jgi:hypothetical protein
LQIKDVTNYAPNRGHKRSTAAFIRSKSRNAYKIHITTYAKSTHPCSKNIHHPPLKRIQTLHEFHILLLLPSSVYPTEITHLIPLFSYFTSAAEWNTKSSNRARATNIRGEDEEVVEGIWMECCRGLFCA